MTRKLIAAIGDIHGCYSEMKSLIQHIYDYAKKNDYSETVHIYLGDYVDRGPDPKAVVQYARNIRCVLPDNHIFLKGNHEDMLLASYDEGLDHSWWISNGGSSTINSYASNLYEVEPMDRSFLRSLPLFYDDGIRFYCHAGVDITKGMNDQTENVLLWSRYSHDLEWDRLVVHGHTPLDEPFAGKNRINIDTGCCFDGKLTSVLFNMDQKYPLCFIQHDGKMIWKY